MRYLTGLLCILVSVCLCPSARADKRVALVIGNSSYENTIELKNAKNDADDISASLARLGFEVIEGNDLDKRSMERTIRQFSLKLSGADLAFFFYAGHGLQVAGKNFLVPTDAKLATENDVDFEGIPLALVLAQMEREAKTNVVLLDACRDNPLARNLARTMGTRSVQVGQGLAEVKVGVGTLIGFSTQPGNVALDGDGRNSPYAEALLKHLEVPKDLSSILVAVRSDVLQTTGGKQVPWEHTSLTGEVFFKQGPPPLVTGATSAPPPATRAVNPNYDKEMEIAFWNAVKDSKSAPVLQTYLDRYPGGTFAGLARVMIDQLKNGGAKAPPVTRVVSLPVERPKLPDSAAKDPATLARALQTELKRVGCDPGPVDGQWGAKGEEALNEFVRVTKIAVPTDAPSDVALQAVTGQKGRICALKCDQGESEVDGKCVASARPEKKTVGRSRSTGEQHERPAREKSPGLGGLCVGVGRGLGFSLCSK